MYIQFIIKYLGIFLFFGALIIFIFLYADLKMDVVYYRLRLFELQEKQIETETLNDSYRKLVKKKILEHKISSSELTQFLPQFEVETLIEETMVKRKSK